MRRFPTTACLAAPLAAAAATATAPAAIAQQRPPLQARVVSCTVGATAAARTATFTASMPAIAGTARMWVRFTLLQRMDSDGEFVRVRLPGWGRWQRSDPGRTAFIYTKKVQGLRAPGAYRARVTFRWYGAGGRLLRTTTRTTRTCRQPDLRPDLEAGALTAGAGLGAGTVTYLLDVVNDAAAPAGPFQVALTVAGMPQPPVRVDGLAPGERQVVSVPGPRCAPGSTVRLVLDPAAAVAESDEADDVADRPCPALPGPSGPGIRVALDEVALGARIVRPSPAQRAVGGEVQAADHAQRHARARVAHAELHIFQVFWREARPSSSA